MTVAVRPEFNVAQDLTRQAHPYVPYYCGHLHSSNATERGVVLLLFRLLQALGYINLVKTSLHPCCL
jgi:hypothetical protein